MADQENKTSKIEVTPVSAQGNEPHPRSVDFQSAGEGTFTGEMHVPSEAEIKARGKRNIAIALAVLGFVVLVYLTTFFRLSENLSAATGAG